MGQWQSHTPTTPHPPGMAPWQSHMHPPPTTPHIRSGRCNGHASWGSASWGGIYIHMRHSLMLYIYIYIYVHMGHSPMNGAMAVPHTHYPHHHQNHTKEGVHMQLPTFPGSSLQQHCATEVALPSLAQALSILHALRGGAFCQMPVGSKCIAKEFKHTHTYTYTHTHIYIYIYAYMHICP